MANPEEPEPPRTDRSASGSARGEIIVQAIVQDVIYRAPSGRFAVIRVALDDGPTQVALGDLGQVAVGETLRLRGRWVEHSTYGRQLQVLSFTPVLPTTNEGIARYLGSGLVPGIGPEIANRLVKRFGGETLDVIATQSGRLREVAGIGRRRARLISEAVRARRVEAETLSYLRSLALGPALSRRLLKEYGDDAARVLRENPYRAAEEVAGIGFRKADQMGQASGIAKDDPRRAEAAIVHLLGAASEQGHVFSTGEELACGLERLEIPVDCAGPALTALGRRGTVMVENDAIYLRALHRAEEVVAARITALSRRRPPVHDADRALASVDTASLTETQRLAVRQALTHGVLVLTGGPGTGKTTTVRAIVQAQEALGRRVLLTAPTGRAAKRLAEATGRDAVTIHRALEWSPATRSFRRNADDPLDVELVLVDEASMLDVVLAESLLAAVPNASRLVLVGDVDQLPPVGPGPVLREVIDSERVEVVRLREVFRQAQESAIVRGAYETLHGRVPEGSSRGARGSGELFVLNAHDPSEVSSKLRAVLARLKDAYRLDLRQDVQVLVPMRRGPLGTERLNEILQAELNPAPNAPPGVLRAGDKVMQLRNDYQREVFNGDLGEVTHIEGGITYVRIDGREVQYDSDSISQLTLAYASTVHKVQGSEFPAAVVILHGAHYVLLSRALLYTAITRAKQVVILLGEPRAFARAARHAPTRDVHTRIAERLRRTLDRA